MLSRLSAPAGLRRARYDQVRAERDFLLFVRLAADGLQACFVPVAFVDFQNSGFCHYMLAFLGLLPDLIDPADWRAPGLGAAGIHEACHVLCCDHSRVA